MRHAGLLLLLVLLVPVASAHAVLLTATPPPNGHADEGLDVVEFRFTEPVEREYTGADVVDTTTGESWAAGPVQFDPEDRSVIRLPVRPLESGLYSASWRALSADTHTTRGSFVFAVGTATIRGQGYDVVVDVPAEGSVLRDGFARFAFYLGLFLVVGVPLFALVVLRDVAPPPSLFAAAVAFGLVGAAGAFVGLLFLGDRTGLGLAAAATGPGRSFVWRGVLALAATLACASVVVRPARWRVAAALSLALGAGAIYATVTGSHAASAPRLSGPLMLADAVHLAMGAVWVGGLVAFVHVGWGRSALEVAALVQRFSPLALASVLALLATGFAASAAHIPCVAQGPLACLEALPRERYMQLVALKLALMVPLIALGAFHKYRAGPRLARGAYSPAAFRRLLQVEAGIMAVVLGAAGVLAATAPPAREDAQVAPVSTTLELQNVTALSHVVLQVSPSPVTVGVQRLVVAVHPLGDRLPNGTTVALKAWPAGEEEPEGAPVFPEKVTPSEWEVEDAFFTAPGDWTVLVIVQRPDEYARLTFSVPVRAAGAAGS